MVVAFVMLVFVGAHMQWSLGNYTNQERRAMVLGLCFFGDFLLCAKNQASLLFEIFLENQLLLISINFTPKTSHRCLKKWYEFLGFPGMKQKSPGMFNYGTATNNV